MEWKIMNGKTGTENRVTEKPILPKFENRTSDGEIFSTIWRDDSPVYFVLYASTLVKSVKLLLVFKQNLSAERKN